MNSKQIFYLLTFSLANAEIFGGRKWWGREVERELCLKYVHVGSKMMCGVAQLSLPRCVTTQVIAQLHHYSHHFAEL